MKLPADGMQFDTNTSKLLQEHVLHEPSRSPSYQSQTIGFERLYKTSASGAFWLHERFYRNAGGDHDNALPLSEIQARAWLKDKFGQWAHFHRLEMRVFGSGTEEAN